MKNPVYISTGCFTGRINGRDPHLLSLYHERLDCDGFELMIYDDLYPDIKATVAEYRRLGINIPVLHTNKAIGDLCSTKGSSSLQAALELAKRDAEIALSLGAEKCVFHPWGIPDSDKYTDTVIERIFEITELGKRLGVEFLPENCICLNKTPLENLKTALKSFSFRVTVDLRAAAFHGELQKTVEELPVESIGHFHIMDYRGAVGDFEARKTFWQPGTADVDWVRFFDTLQARGCGASMSLEASHMLCDGVACDVFNPSLDFIKKHLKAR